jgi:hypothetical protein
MMVRFILIFGTVLVLTGLFWPLLARVGLSRLAG